MSILSQFANLINQNNDFSSLSSAVGKVASNIEEKLFLDVFSTMDDEFFNSQTWKENYTCNGFVSRTIITPYCKVTFKRRYYMNKNKSLHDNFYYLDQALNLPTRKHLTNDALALIFNYAVEVNSSYASKHAIPNVVISKQTVSNYQKHMNTIIDGVPTIDDTKNTNEPVDVIYIEADEAHCNLQQEVSIDDSKDELKTSSLCKIKTKHKNIINKLVLTHTGHSEPNLRLKRKSLANKHYFGGIHIDPITLADNVYYSINSQYDLSKVKYIFVSGDGARWIKSLYTSLCSTLKNYDLEIIPVLDKFHTNKYLKTIFSSDTKIITYIKDNFEDMTIERFISISNAYYAFSLKDKIKEESFNQAIFYICNNIQEIKNQKHPFYKCHCAMEGQISHILAKRLTSRPAGFCEEVLQNLSQMIIFKNNGNNITADIVKEWSKEYLSYQKPKYNHIVKSYKRTYANEFELPVMQSTNTNLKHYFQTILYPKFS